MQSPADENPTVTMPPLRGRDWTFVELREHWAGLLGDAIARVSVPTWLEGYALIVQARDDRAASMLASRERAIVNVLPKVAGVAIRRLEIRCAP